MPRGRPDYDNPAYSIADITLDPSLVVTAMKGVNSVDGKGRVWRVDNFSDGFGAWTGDTAGDGASPVLSATQPEVGSVSIKLQPGTLAGSGESNLRQCLIVATPVFMGIEAGVYFDNLSADYFITVDYRRTGASFYGQAKISEASRSISIRQAAGFTEIASLDTQTFTGGWLPIKLVMDFDGRLYKRFVYGGNSIDISSYSAISAATNGIGSLYISIGYVANAANNQDGFIGHTIFTLDEP